MMEFEEEHEEEEEEAEEEEDSELAITPTFKKHHHQQQQQLPPSTTTPTTTVRYRECLKNHAVGMGGHAVDGCGEFMPAGADGSLDALRCAACNCHRNFHRKELFILDTTNNININTTSSAFNQQLTLYSPRPHHHPHQVYQFYPYNRTTSGVGGYVHHSRQLALPSPTTPPGIGNHRSNHQQGEEGPVVVGSGGENVNSNNNNVVVGGGGTGMMMMMSGSSSGKKRFRTKFTQEQKDKMLCLAEKLGWKIQKQDEGAVQQFCHETGVKRHVLKVWMHNNKHTLGKKP